MGAIRFNETDLITVLNELTDFGLNPYEWALVASTIDTLEFAHVDDPHFKIDVKIQPALHGSQRVAQLSVISI